jgi:hypothetical protein
MHSCPSLLLFSIKRIQEEQNIIWLLGFTFRNQLKGKEARRDKELPHRYKFKYSTRRRIRLIEINAKYLRLKSNLEKDFAAAVYYSEAPSPPQLLSLGGHAIL